MACVCVYGAASNRIDEAFISEVEYLGKLLATRGHSIIYGAGATGLMGAIARGVKENGGKVVGVTPHFMHEFEPIFDCTETINTETMAERKAVMESCANAFIVVPGGIGTFDEFFQIMTLKELGRLGDKPIVLLNVKHYYDELYQMMKAANSKGFLRESVMTQFSLSETPEEAIAYIEECLKNN